MFWNYGKYIEYIKYIVSVVNFGSYQSRSSFIGQIAHPIGGYDRCYIVNLASCEYQIIR